LIALLLRKWLAKPPNSLHEAMPGSRVNSKLPIDQKYDGFITIVY